MSGGDSSFVPKLPSKYRSEVGSEDLDSAVLESEIRSLEASLHSIREMYNAMVGDESTSASTLSSLSNRMDDLLKQRNEKMDKLRKLNMFAGSSNEVFSVGEEGSLIDGLAQNLQTGLSQIRTEFASFGGTFSLNQQEYAVFLLINKAGFQIDKDFEFSLNWKYDGQFIYQNQRIGYKISDSGVLPDQSATILTLPISREQKQIVETMKQEEKMSLEMSDLKVNK